MKTAIIIPFYNHATAIKKIALEIIALDLPIILVNDGSSNDCDAVLEELALLSSVTVINRASNGGKGAAVITGMHYAHENGYSHVFQVDADGQHDVGSILKFSELSQANPKALICGYPKYDQSVPKHRFYARYLTHVWVWIESLSFEIKDSMCGFRVYPLASAIKLLETKSLKQHMGFDTDIIVRLLWQGVPIISSPVAVYYPENGVSHFKPVMDNIEITKTHTHLFFGMLLRLPKLVLQRLLK